MTRRVGSLNALQPQQLPGLWVQQTPKRLPRFLVHLITKPLGKRFRSKVYNRFCKLLVFVHDVPKHF